jgi:hypothetical protein
MVCQSLLCLITEWTAGVRSSAGAEDFSSSPCVQTGSGAHPASCTVGTGGLFLGANRGRVVTLTTHPHLVSRSGMRRSPQAPPWKVAGQLYYTLYWASLISIHAIYCKSACHIQVIDNDGEMDKGCVLYMLLRCSVKFHFVSAIFLSFCHSMCVDESAIIERGEQGK